MSNKRVKVRCPFCGHTQELNPDDLDQPSPPIYKVYKVDPAPRRYRTECRECGRRFVITIPGRESNDE